MGVTPRDTHLHFSTFKNSNLCSKTNINETAWINAWYPLVTSLAWLYNVIATSELSEVVTANTS